MFTCEKFTYLVVPASSTSSLSLSAIVMPVPSLAPSTCIAAPLTLSAVEMVANLLSAIAAELLTSAFTITPLAMATAPADVIEMSPLTALFSQRASELS